MKNEINKEDIELILDLSNAFGPSGAEEEVISILKKELKGHLNREEDSMLNLICEYEMAPRGHKKVLLDAHMDEVGFMVQAIRPNGLLEVLPLGGIQKEIAPGMPVKVRTANGFVKGVLSIIPPHFSSEAKESCLLADVGATSSSEATNQFGVEVGNFVCPDVNCVFDEQNDIFIGKAFDCRIGVAAMTRVLEDINPKRINVDLAGAFTAQEEVGDRGAKLASNYFKPDLCIVFEGCPADDTCAPEYKVQAGIKRGPMIRHMDRSIICNTKFMKYVKDIAKLNNIPLQEAVRAGGGNNGAVYQENGAPTVVIGIPVRYTHGAFCIASYQDFSNAVKLAEALVCSLTDDIIKGF